MDAVVASGVTKTFGGKRPVAALRETSMLFAVALAWVFLGERPGPRGWAAAGVIALGAAVIEAWGRLPQDIQHLLFEAAVVAGHRDERDESLRAQLAVFLHERHPRTQDDA